MNEDIKIFYDDAKEKMDMAIKHLENELLKIRAGKANPNMLNSVLVNYYGVNTPLAQISNVNTPDPRTIVVQPWEKNMIEPIEKAIMAANLGLNPVNNGEIIRLIVPILTEERRKQLVKQARNEGENSKISIRNIRRDFMEELKQLKKDGVPEDDITLAEEEGQKTTDTYIKKVDFHLEKKEKDIMTV